MVTTHNLGFPANTINRQQAQTSESVWRQQVGSDLISIGSDTVADPVAFMIDALGQRSGEDQIKPKNKSQWFGSSMDYVVPEFTEASNFSANADSLIQQVEEAQASDLTVKPVIIGPISYLWFGEAKDDMNKLDLLNSILPAYADLLARLSDVGIDWVQFDEPVLAEELSDDWKHALLQAYYDLQRAPVKKMIASYFGSLGDNLGLLRELSVDGVHIDTISADDEALKVADLLPNYKVLSVAVVDGSQHAETDFVDTLAWLKTVHEIVGDRLWLAPSCSLAHLPKESKNEPEIENAKLKMSEVKALAMILDEISNTSKLKLVTQRAAA